MMVHITGNRVSLRDWSESDLVVWRNWLLPKHRWHELDGPYYPRPNSLQIDEMIAGKRGLISSGDWPVQRRNLVIASADDQSLIGVVTWYWENEETNWLSLGIVIFDPDCWGRGSGYEALGLWSQYRFDNPSAIVRLDLRRWSGNFDMMRLAEKLSYTLEARFRMARIVNGKYFDSLGYGVLRAEWENRFPGGFRSSIS